MINKNIKKIFAKTQSVKKIPGLKTNLRPEKIKPDIYYKITEFFEKDHFLVLFKRIIFSNCLKQISKFSLIII